MFFNQYSRNCFVPGVHIWSLLGTGQKLFEIFAYYTLVPEGTGQKLFEIFELLIPQSLRDSPQGHFGPARAEPKILRIFGLPDHHSLLCWKEHGSVGDGEGIVEGLDVAEGRVHAVLAERVYIDLCQAGSLLVADVLAPDCCV